jgi:hypothetical protein
MKLVWMIVCLLGLALAGGGGPNWRLIDEHGHSSPASSVQLNRPCPPLKLPASWQVQDQVFADVTGDGLPQCLLVIWRPWRDWPTRRWLSTPSRIAANRDAQGRSAHLAVLTVLPGGRFRERWVGSALVQPITAITALPGHRVAVLETSYERGPTGPSLKLSVWSWTGFGFRREERWPVPGRRLAVSGGRPMVR